MRGAEFPTWAWLVFIGLVAGLLLLDLFVFHRNARKIPFRESLALSGFWVAVSAAFGGFVWFLAGPTVAGEYYASYLIEWSLSLDNVFVWAVIFGAFAVPEQYRYHVLFWGVIGALVFRAAFVAAGIELLSAFTWLVFVFGALLIFTGLRIFRRGGGGEETDHQSNRALRFVERFVPFTEEISGDRFFTKQNGKRYATPLFGALVVIETSDVVFAVDSVPAVLSITSSTFVAYSAVAFAILGLRSLYFALDGLIDRFAYLHYGLAAILVFVGARFVFEGLGLHLPIFVSLLSIAAILTVSIVASLFTARRGDEGSKNRERQ